MSMGLSSVGVRAMACATAWGAMAWLGAGAEAQVAVRARIIHTMAGTPVRDGVVLVGADGKIERVGAGASVTIPEGYEVIECAVLTPGLVDVRTTVGLTGMYNVDQDQDVLEPGAPMQPELRAVDAYNPREPLVGYIRSFGVTTVHTGHAPGALISGQTAIFKTRGDTVDAALVKRDFAVTATLGGGAMAGGDKSPGTRAKQVEMLREKLIKAQEFARKDAAKADDASEEGEGKDAKPPARDLAMEALVDVLKGPNTKPLIITANRAQDIASALALGREFGITVWLDMASEAYLLLDELRSDGGPVLLHPTMYRAWGETSNLSLETAKILADAGITFAIESGYEGYVPKVRVVLFEAAAAAGYGGLGFERALAAVTIIPADILGIADRVGSIEVGKDGDLAMYDGDPFEYTTHCVGVLIEGERFPGELEYEIKYP
ncbi:MAG: amidohydrolase family protein [Phycisphaerales bacterium]|jgi:imidazolonepropionase-like amidohydrolase|nr:amidohydrolase family protein [Phycisphaerales bacterium]